jgi:hypothetical protein
VEHPKAAYRLGVAAARRLARLGPTTIEPGLSDAELAQAERRFDISFADDHRTFLGEGLPVGERWPDWRNGNTEHLAQLLRLPTDGVLFDVVENGFWYGSWGLRPDNPDEAVLLAGEQLSGVPRLIPVYGHRYLPQGRGSFGHPVLSIEQTDIVVYGADLDDYLRREFEGLKEPLTEHRPPPVFWADLAS